MVLLGITPTTVLNMAAAYSGVSHLVPSSGVFANEIAMIIYGPKNAPYDIDVGPVLLTDWYHTDYFTIVEEVVGIPPGFPFSDNNLINGKMDFDCSKVTTGQACKTIPLLVI